MTGSISLRNSMPWKIEARGKTFEPGMKTLIPPFSLGYKKRVYSPNRILYPLKRVDWDPKARRNPENRGNSKLHQNFLGRSSGHNSQRDKEDKGKIWAVCHTSSGGWTWGEESCAWSPWRANKASYTFWVVIPCKPEIRIAGRDGSGGQNMCGEWSL